MLLTSTAMELSRAMVGKRQRFNVDSAGGCGYKS